MFVCYGIRAYAVLTFALTFLGLVAAQRRLYASQQRRSDPFANDESPFDDLSTRAPATLQERKKAIEENAERVVEEEQQQRYRGRGGYYHHGGNSLLYSLYPLLYPEGADYCPRMRAHFRYHCQPSKSLRLDLVEFCKKYSKYCGVVNTHRLPGPGYWRPDSHSPNGHVDVSGNFNFGIGVVPGLEVGAGWGVDVGPIPGMENTESVGVGINTGLGILGASVPEKYRRGYDHPSDKKGGLFGLSGGVGVNAPGSGPIGVGTGVGVGK